MALTPEPLFKKLPSYKEFHKQNIVKLQLWLSDFAAYLLKVAFSSTPSGNGNKDIFVRKPRVLPDGAGRSACVSPSRRVRGFPLGAAHPESLLQGRGHRLRVAGEAYFLEGLQT